DASRFVGSNTPITNVLAFSPNGRTIIGLFWPGRVLVWDALSAKLRFSHTLGESTGFLRGLAFSPDSRLAAIPYKNLTCILDLQSGQIRYTLSAQEVVESAVFSADGRTLATAHKDFHIYLWDIQTGERIQQIQAGSGWGLRFSPDGRLISAAI